MIKILLFYFFIGLTNLKCSITNTTKILHDQISNPNKIILSGQIDKIVLTKLIDQIDLMTESNLDKNIFILIDSIGGDLIEGIQFINWMEKQKIEKNLRFECICIRAISTAFNIYQYCDYRYIIETCLMIQHEPKIIIEGTFDFVTDYYLNKFQTHLNMYNEIIDKISNKIGIDSSEYKNKFINGDWIINNTDEIFLNNLADKQI